MRNKYKAKLRLRQKQELFKSELKKLTDAMDKDYPDWQKEKDAKYIKKRLIDTARLMCNNRQLKKTKTLYKKDFPDWPFTVDSIIVIQTSKKMISCMIDFREYALNGLAESGLKLKFPHDCKKAIVGKSVSKFIKIGMDL